MLTPSMPDKRPTGWCHFSHPVAPAAPAGESAAPKSLLDLTRKAKLEKDAFSLSCLLLQPAPDAPRATTPALDFGDIAPEAYDDEDGWGDDDGGEWNGPDADFFHAPEGGWPKTAVARILSDPIRLPDRGIARYACTERGLALIVNALRIPSGAALQIRWPERDERDLKTGALTVTLPPAPQPRDARAKTPAVEKAYPARNAAGGSYTKRPEESFGAKQPAEGRASSPKERPPRRKNDAAPGKKPRPAAPDFARPRRDKKIP